MAMRNLLIVASAALIAAPAFANEPETDPRVGAEVGQVCFARTISGWRHLDGERAVLLRSRSNRWHRAELAGACSASDLRFAVQVGLETRPAGGCVSRGDAILVRGGGDIVHRCVITRLNEWNEDAGDEDEEG